MTFLFTLIAVVIAAIALRKPIVKAPWVFYALAVLLDVVLLMSQTQVLPLQARLAIAYLMQRGGLGVATFILVMYIGVLPRASWASRWLRPIRAELSIIACILIAGHMCVFLPVYAMPFFTGNLSQINVIGAFAMALCLLVLVLVLGITSFRFVKRRMKARTWRKIQRFAYLFYALVFAHVTLMLAPAAAAGNTGTAATMGVYCVVFVVYTALRIHRAQVDRREKIDLEQTIIEQGFVE
ncbi:Ferric reductase like transmembrane component [Slackia heliotrinireducens]|uniref:Predicted membrane protein n=1 Tax=Slackia heliotrinireducens (strain ATCC 29202 / DSM 20476 / NCTC 11029 / RHS 1) TaxID=471855 RepID=C7N865_SLAHD|nr:ferric reductase-like transmembrane domain-containing protein [Slackia heliotrinireducens]ACV23100.1 predicted membrane protein [Slackia heliotrinireducens DSM 20476]VEH02093.1 Ferric reductase like transmembrane component [Slackia heliotrinireducens]